MITLAVARRRSLWLPVYWLTHCRCCGIAGALLPGETPSADMVEAVREGITYQPRLEEGQGSLQTVGQVLGPMGEWLGGLETFLGDNTMDLTGSPLAATAATAAPTALMELLGLGTLKKTSKAAQQPTGQKKWPMALLMPPIPRRCAW